jgi:phage-related protein
MNQAYTDEANKLAAAGAWILLLEISKTGYTTIRYTSDNAAVDPTHFNMEWDGDTYYSVPFVLEDVHASLKGELHEYGLRIEVGSLTETLRTVVKASGGLVGGMVKVMVVHSAHLSLTTPAVEMESEILDCTVTAEAITFRLGMASPYKKRFPRDRYVPGFCRHKFGGALCGYEIAGYTLTSSLVQFIRGSGYHTILVGDGNLVTSVFEHVRGRRQCVGNLVTNGDFEDGVTGSASGWTGGSYVSDWELWGSAAAADRRWSGDRAKYGDKSYYHIGHSSYAGVWQSVSVTPNTLYTVSCWVYVQGGGANSLRIATTVTGGGYAAPTGVGAWEKVSVTVNTGVRSSLGVYVGGVGAAYFDGVSVVQGSTAGVYDRYALGRDTAFTVSGSQYNDGLFLADNYYAVDEEYVRVVTGDDIGRVLVAEAAGMAVTISLGYVDCDHTLEGCKLRNNLANYGGSPGISGGAYG